MSSPQTPSYHDLRKQGITQIARLGSANWTDYNTHDPGITILEQVCYALTDLNHRTTYNIADLLTPANTNGSADALADFFPPEDILPSNPITLADLRRLLLDIKGVNNAWIESEKDPQPRLYFDKESSKLYTHDDGDFVEPVVIKGLFHVYIQPNREASTELYQIVVQCLHAHRNLCEDFSAITVLRKQPIVLETDIEIAPHADASQIHQQILIAIDRFMTPPLRFYSLEERLAKGEGIETMFEGPLLKHGFIDLSEIRTTRPTSLRLSDLIHVIMDIEGVSVIRSIHAKTTQGHEQWRVKLEDNCVPELDLFQTSINLFKRQLKIELPKQDAVLPPVSSSLPIGHTLRPARPVGRNLQVGEYYSIQHQFPDNYGVNPNGSPLPYSAQRRAQGKQLKAYLLFFDQLLANQHAQLAHFRELFSLTRPKDAAVTYFSQILKDAELGLDQALSNDAGLWLKDLDTRTRELQTLTDQASRSNVDSLANERRQRFLNHLLARFAEQFVDQALSLDTRKPFNSNTVAACKQEFLAHYPRLSHTRANAFNYLQTTHNKDNRSGLEQRLRYRLGLEQDDPDFYLMEHILLRPLEQDKDQIPPLLDELKHADPYSLQFSLIFPVAEAPYDNPAFQQWVRQTVLEETPAHLVAKLHWLDEAKMQRFRQLYEDGAWFGGRRDHWMAAQ